MRTLGVAAAVLLAATLLSSSGVGAGDAVTTYVVTTTRDGDAGPSSDLSLRDAVAAAAEDDTDSRIVLAIGGEYLLERCTDGVDALVHDSATALAVEGRGAVVEQTCDGERVLQANGSGALRLDDLVITGGDSREPGGGVAVDGPQQVVLTGVTFIGNRSRSDGGALAVIGTGVAIRRSLFEDNSARRGGAAWVNGDVTVNGSTFAGNEAATDGGAIYAGRDVHVRRSTFSGNRAEQGTGAAVDARYLQLHHVTASGDLPSADGAAVRARSLGLRAGASIVAAGAGADCDVAQDPFSAGYNRSTTPTCGFSAATDREDWTPALAPLGEVGGPLPTHLPLATGDAVVDVIPSADGELCGGGDTQRFDQREVGLPQGDGCDVGAVETPDPFSDVGPASPFYAEVAWMGAEGLSNGYGDGTYRPEEQVTRGALAAFLARTFGDAVLTPPPEPTFSDVGTDHPFYAEVEWLAAEGIAEGFADGTFAPDVPVARQAVAAFLHRATGAESAAPTVATFSDVPLAAPFSTEVEWMAASGLSGGFADGTWHPEDEVTRQAIARWSYVLRSSPDV